MTLPSDAELHNLVHEVVARTLPGNGVPQRAAASPAGNPAPRGPAQASQTGTGPVALGADHGGFAMKEILKKHLEGQGYAVIDCGTHSTDSVDYPDFARAVAALVGEGKA